MLVHAEAPGPLEAAPQPQGRSYAGYLASRPPSAEVVALEMVLGALRATGGRAHILHLSSAEGLTVIGRARDEGLRISVETCPHYLSLAAEDIPDGATQTKCAPPIRSRANRELLWAALGDGSIDFVASDHSPAPPSVKALDTGDFGAAWGGISGIQTAMPVVWTEAAARGFGLLDVARWQSARTAAMAGLPGKAQSPWATTPTSSCGTPTHRSSSTRPRWPSGTRSRRGTAVGCGVWCTRPTSAARPSTSAASPTAPCSSAGAGHVTELALLDLPDLAAERFGGTVVACSDDFFGSALRLLHSGAPVSRKGTFDEHGQWMDGWESSRRRDGREDDWVVVRLGAAGIVRLAVIDTSFFDGNQPSSAFLQGACLPGNPSPAEVLAARWTDLLADVDLYPTSCTPWCPRPSYGSPTSG